MSQAQTPKISEFDPTIIPWQEYALDQIENQYDYSLGLHELLLSGSVGSAKSVFMSHIIVKHCLENNGARFLIGRKTLPSLKATLFRKILEHIGDEIDVHVNEQSGNIKFPNGSTIISHSWADRKFMKIRSEDLSGAAIEELTENEEQDFYTEIKMRVGRLSGINKSLIICATNPDDPSHWAHKYFIDSTLKTRHAIYSSTADNPFLPSWYVTQLREELDPRMARRMIYGEWISINDDVVYSSYDPDKSAVINNYKIDPGFPIRIAYDFNIGDGKPMSAIIFQYINGTFFCFDECVLFKARTDQHIEEIASKDIFENKNEFIIHGDRSGKTNQTSSIRTDYEIIERFIANYQRKDGSHVNYKFEVPLANPSIRDRHNVVNAILKNDLNDVRLFLDKTKCKTLHEGFLLTKLKKGGNYIEDDSKPYQHITTAFGYGAHYIKRISERKKQIPKIL